MFGIKKYILDMDNMMVASDKLNEIIPNQTKPNQNLKLGHNNGFGQLFMDLL